MPVQEFQYFDDRLYCETVALEAVADAVGTPAYVYSSQAIRDNYRSYDQSLARIPHDIHYAVKANSSLAVLALLGAEGAGFDIVSAGELYRVLRAGGDPAKVVYSGVGKTKGEIRYALEQRIGRFCCESRQELAVLRELAVAMRSTPNVALRVNPDISAETHPYIATGLSEHKFGIGVEEAEALYRDATAWAPLQFTGVSCHIGSQIFDTRIFQEALCQLLALTMRLRAKGITIQTVDLGGGLAVAYKAGQRSASIGAFGRMLCDAMERTGLHLALEPGRSVVGQAGVLLTRVLYRKQSSGKTFLVVDGAMNDLIRPALYQAHHEILPTSPRHGPHVPVDVVGPVCESGDFLASQRDLPPCEPGDLLAVATAGAYGFVQSSNYNSRPRAAEVLIEGNSFRVVRRREDREDLVRGESV